MLSATSVEGGLVAGLEMAASGCAKTSGRWGRATLGLGIPEL